ncbi:alpha/beta hydrolase [Streptomyces sp. NBC_01408]|uniref:alpha/beta hydrolase n=1 Tax=Streptomyces sp. NBC_01408 TaxID=2903855 RepID=UPI002251FC71|nr:alpha/beta hydrolase [Streptomyces sp. NBC_01408]MCX4695286.1 alpha/beta hydrolase [Streptomyces sp. NBC_01408]
MSPLRRPTRSAVLATAALLAVSALTACDDGGAKKADAKIAASPSPSPSPTALPAALTGQQLAWQGCAAPSAAQGGGEAPGAGWECTAMKVPLDYAQPAGETIDLALIRKKATDSGKRIGSLVYNFGGPGGSGVQTLPLAAAEDYKKLNAVYDLVSFDPRGVGNSAGVKCVDDKTMDELNASEDSEGSRKKFTEGCKQNSAKILPHVGTTNAARDLDVMRQVLGEQKLNYFGISYGTELGGVYAHLFPANVGRTVFDAVVDPTQDSVQKYLGQVKGFQSALEHAMQYCVKKYKANCPTGPNATTGAERINAMLAKLEKKPAAAEGGRKLTADMAETGIIATLYSEDRWDHLVQGIAEVQKNGTGNNLLYAADTMSGRDDKGRYDTSVAAHGAIRCADDSTRITAEQAAALVPEFRKASPVFGEVTAEELMADCQDWPVKGERAKPEVSATGAAPILVIGNTGDPATPVEGARRMADALGKGVGIGLTVKGEGHGTYGVNSCATKTVDEFLIDGKVPADGGTCE